MIICITYTCSKGDNISLKYHLQMPFNYIRPFTTEFGVEFLQKPDLTQGNLEQHKGSVKNLAVKGPQSAYSMK